MLEPDAFFAASDAAGAPTDADAAGLDVTAAYGHGRRVQRLLALPLTSLLFHAATVSYRRSCQLKRVQKNCDGETVPLS